MLSYRHAYHAGNHADVLKHFVIERILSYLVRKDKPCFYLDTHSGTGLYALDSVIANKTAEYQQGIALLLKQDKPPKTIEPYIDAVKNLQDKKGLIYPGSPWIAANRLRAQDRLAFCELHPQDFPALQKNFYHDDRVKTYCEDGFSKAIALMPPKEKRGLIVIDPSYEIKADYNNVIHLVKELHRRFHTGTFAIWYPIINSVYPEQLHRKAVSLGIKNTYAFELQISKVSAGGMYASGMLVFNSPYRLKDTVNEALPWMVKHLAQDSDAKGKVACLVGE